MDRSDIAAVMELVPSLNDFGIGLFDNGRGLTAEQRKAELETNRQKLLASSEACTRICQWLAAQAKIQTINTKHTSSDLAQLAKQDIGFITNGAFIASAIHCGFKYRLIPPNAQFGISEKTLRVPVAGHSSGLVQTKPRDITPAAAARIPQDPPAASLQPRDQTVRWSGEVPPHKWINFYTKVLCKLVSTKGLKLKVTFEAPANGEGNQAKARELRSRLKELGLDEDLRVD